MTIPPWLPAAPWVATRTQHPVASGDLHCLLCPEASESEFLLRPVHMGHIDPILNPQVLLQPRRSSSSALCWTQPAGGPHAFGRSCSCGCCLVTPVTCHIIWSVQDHFTVKLYSVPSSLSSPLTFFRCSLLYCTDRLRGWRAMGRRRLKWWTYV